MSILTFLSGIYIAEEMSGEQNELNSCGENFGKIKVTFNIDCSFDV